MDLAEFSSWSAAHEGGKEAVVEEILEIVDDYGSWAEAMPAIREYIEDLKRGFESL